MAIEHAVGRYLTNLGVLTLDEVGTGGDTFLGAMPSSPDLAVMLKPTGGMGLTNEDGYDEPTLQVMTRGEPHDRPTPYDRITAIYNQLVGLRAIWLDPGGDAETYVVRVLAMQSAPADLGRDENERWRWSHNYQLLIRNKTDHRK